LRKSSVACLGNGHVPQEQRYSGRAANLATSFYRRLSYLCISGKQSSKFSVAEIDLRNRRNSRYGIPVEVVWARGLCSPFAVEALPVDGGCECQLAIERACQERGVASTVCRAIIEEGTFRLLERKFKRISSGDLMIKEASPSICYIVPSYSTDEASHMAHLPRLLSEVGKYCDLHVIIQRGSGQPEITNAQSVYVQRPGNHVQRAVELIHVASQLRRQGCQKFFIRISASAALELNLLSRFVSVHLGDRATRQDA
jgi:hypothetical protein